MGGGSAGGGSAYQRIVDDIRRRIDTGELHVGDRVPSARQITRDWGVAIATATRALGELRRAGLVRAVPGVGTIVAAEPVGSEPAGVAPAGVGPAGVAPAGVAPAGVGLIEAGPVGSGWVGSGPARPAGARPTSDRPAAGEPPRRRTLAAGHGLHREVIVRAAIAIADAEGAAAVSMRRIGTHLGVATMSLYRHVSDKDELFLLMIDQVLGEERLPSLAGVSPPGEMSPATAPPATAPPGTALPGAVPIEWRDRLDTAARTLWVLFRRHRWLAAAMSLTRPQLVPNALVYADWVLGTLAEFGLDPSAMIHVHVMLFSYVRGLAMNFETEATAEQDTGLTSDEWMDSQEEMLVNIAGSGPLGAFLRAAGEAPVGFDLDTLFEFGLARMLDGLDAFLSTHGRPAAGPG